jgi:CheY-like chemotaxis protein
LDTGARNDNFLTRSARTNVRKIDLAPHFNLDRLARFLATSPFVRAAHKMAISLRRPHVLVADDSTVAREGIAAIIRRDLRYALSGLATDQRTLNELLQQHKPDLLLLELFLGNCDGIFLLKELAARSPKTRILAVSRQPEEIYAERALRAGASGYWMKSWTREELIHAIETVLAGELYVSPRIALRDIYKVVDHPPAVGNWRPK